MKLVSPGEDRAGLAGWGQGSTSRLSDSVSLSKHQETYPLGLSLGTSDCNIAGSSLAMGGGQGEAGPGVPFVSPQPCSEKARPSFPDPPPSAQPPLTLPIGWRDFLKTEKYTQNQRQ